MKRLNNKGFTLVELIATIVLLALVMGIGSYSITKIIENSKKKDYNLLIENINNAIEDYYIECKYDNGDDSTIECPGLSGGYYSVSLNTLVKYGFLTGNEKNASDEYTLINPIIKEEEKKNISDCIIKYKYENGKMVVQSGGQNTHGSCPSSY